MNQIIKNLTIQNLRNFIHSFDESKNIFWNEEAKRLTHSGEFGTYREDLVKKWIRIVVPEKFGISSGFVINSNGAISTQCDIIIYDKTVTPKIENIDNQRFFPVETISCIGEIKSDINSSKDLNNYLIKLSEIKKMRDDVLEPIPYFRKAWPFPYMPKINSFDNIFSFILCNKFNFQFDINNIDYKDIEQRLRHNLILSLRDGIVNYKTNNTSNLCFPFNGSNNHSDNYLKNDMNDLPCHILSFLTSLHLALTTTTTLGIDMTYYLTDSVLTKIE